MSSPTSKGEAGGDESRAGDDARGKPSLVTPEELADMMANTILYDGPKGKKVDHSTLLMKAYLLKNVPEFAQLMEYRVRGWVDNKEKGDAHFKQQREKADNTNAEGEGRFFSMMVQIAEEMHELTGVFRLPTCRGGDPKVLDICMAPGGYTFAVLKRYPAAKCYALTLDPKNGGHPIKMSLNRLAGLRHLDVTLLKTEFWGDRPVPETHPGRSSFLPLRPFRHTKFDLVFCDGMVLRTQSRPTWREQTEATRLSCSQLILALQRVVSGGTIVMLLHKVDSWLSASLLYTFSKFAKVEVFKPVKKHAPRSSFYMIAKEVNPDAEAAQAAVQEWKEAWWKVTFDGPEGTGEEVGEPAESKVLMLLEEYGERLIEMGRPVWNIQSNALSKTDYAGVGFARDKSMSPATPQLSSPATVLQENIPPLNLSPN